MIKKEADLYEPIKQLFAEEGYKVNAEVKGFDIVLSKSDELIIIELKLRFNVSLLYQAIKAQRVSPLVYIAITTPASKNKRDIIHITKSLGLGLITVSRTGFVSILLHPTGEAGIKQNPKRKELITKEINRRSFDNNIGGSRGKKLLTAYREESIQIAVALLIAEKALSPKTLIADWGCPPKTQQILYNNLYNWFERISRGHYSLSSTGKAALNSEQYTRIVEHFKEHYKSM